jgi:hypothetical protein
MVSLTEIAKYTGVSISHLSKKKAEGLPQDSLESAKDWLDRNRKNPPRSPNLQPKPLAPEDQKPQELDTPSVTKRDLLRDDIYGCLARAKQSEKFCYALLHQAQANQDHARLPNLVKAHKEALRGRLEAEERVEALQISTGSVIGVDLAKNILSRYMMTIRSLLENMPSSICRRVNPSDPELAKDVLEEAIDKVISVIHKTKGSFGQKNVDETEESDITEEQLQEQQFEESQQPQGESNETENNGTNSN